MPASQIPAAGLPGHAAGIARRNHAAHARRVLRSTSRARTPRSANFSANIQRCPRDVAAGMARATRAGKPSADLAHCQGNAAPRARRRARPALSDLHLLPAVLGTRASRVARLSAARASARPPGWRDLFAHYHCFAQTILDRVLLLTGQTDQFDCRIEGVDVLRGVLAQGRGCLLYGAHFGSFDVLRALGFAESPVAVNVLMHEENAEKLNSVLAVAQPRVAATGHSARPPGDDAQGRGGAVPQRNRRPARRPRRRRRQDACAAIFSMARRPFPKGPFILASVLRAPVVLFSAMYCGGRQYRVRFESFRMRQAAAIGTPRRCVAAEGPALCRLARSQLPRGSLQLVQLL